MSASLCLQPRRALPIPAILGLLVALMLFAEMRGAAPAPSPTPVTLNVRDFGAIGDGRLHRVSEWLRTGRFASMRQLRKTYPFVDTEEWSIDEIAFTQARLALPATGGTIHFPVGHYVAGKQAWTIWRDNLRITGEGADRTILSTAPGIPEGMSVAPYRHVGWLEGAGHEFPFTPESGARGDDCVRLKVSDWTSEFRRGDLVFIRNGANRFDQDYGEFNEIAGSDADGWLRLKYPLSRDYTLARFNWAGEIAADFKIPPPNRSAWVTVRTGDGYFLPSPGTTVSVGGALFTVAKSEPPRIRLVNPGRGNPAVATVIAAGTKMGKSRTILKLTRTTRNFRCENLQIVGRRKALTVSNSYDTQFSDCILVRDTRAGGVDGGLTIDGDGGRFARFERCKILALPAAPMQFARSFGNVVFSGCTFVDANVAFTEFDFECEVARCSFEINDGPNLANVIIAGKSCGALRFFDNRIQAYGVAAIFDTHADIQSAKHASEGDFVVRGNVVKTDAAVRLYAIPKSDRLNLEGTVVTRH